LSAFYEVDKAAAARFGKKHMIMRCFTKLPRALSQLGYTIPADFKETIFPSAYSALRYDQLRSESGVWIFRAASGATTVCWRNTRLVAYTT
jgi:hypothetical protein